MPPLYNKSVENTVVKERQWSTAVAVVISSGPAFLLGVTLGFPSLLLVDVKLSTTQADSFGVSFVKKRGKRALEHIFLGFV